MKDEIVSFINNNYFFNEYLFPKGINGENAIRFDNLFKDFFKLFKNDIEILININNIDTAIGENLRRIGKNIGFEEYNVEDEVFRKNMIIYLLSQRSNGSYNFTKNIGSFLGISSEKINIWKTQNKKYYEYYIDILINDINNLNTYDEEILKKLRYPSAPVEVREVIDIYKGMKGADFVNIEPKDIITRFEYPQKIEGNELSHWGGTIPLDPLRSLNHINILKLGNPQKSEITDHTIKNVVYEVNETHKSVKKVENEIEYIEFDVSNFDKPFTEIGLFSNERLLVKVSFKERKHFTFSKKIITFCIQNF